MIGHGIGDAWMVVFSDTDPLDAQAGRRDRALAWLLRRLKPGFRHVWALKRAEHFNGWVALNATSCGVHVFEVADGSPVQIPSGKGVLAGQTFADYHAFLMAMDDAGLASIVVAPVQPGRFWRPRGLFTCVSAIKHALGIEAPWVWTPLQLHRHLTKDRRG